MNKAIYWEGTGFVILLLFNSLLWISFAKSAFICNNFQNTSIGTFIKIDVQKPKGEMYALVETYNMSSHNFNCSVTTDRYASLDDAEIIMHLFYFITMKQNACWSLQ